MNNLFSRAERITLLKKNDMRIQAHIHYDNLEIEVDNYYTIEGFWGDEDYYQHYIVVQKAYLGKLLNRLNKKVKADTVLACKKEMYSTDSADIDLISLETDIAAIMESEGFAVRQYPRIKTDSKPANFKAQRKQNQSCRKFSVTIHHS